MTPPESETTLREDSARTASTPVAIPCEALVSLLHLCDSLFPLGAFAHSDGLEAATASHRVLGAEDVGCWLDVCLDETLGCSEGPAVVDAWRNAAAGRWGDLGGLDAEVYALRCTSVSRRASRAMGGRLLKTWRRIHPTANLGPLRDSIPDGMELTLPVAFGVACASADIGARAALAGYFYTRLAAATSAAMRLVPVGQNEAHARLASALTRMPALIDRLAECERLPSAFAPALDIAVMSHQYVHSRLFRS